MIQIVLFFLLGIFLLIESIQALLSRNNGKFRELFSTVLIVFSSSVWLFSFLDFYFFSISICRFPSVIGWLGNIIFGAGIFVRTLAFIQLGQFYHYNLNIKSGHRLIKTGIYSRVRHPLYLGTLAVFLGFPIVFSSAGGIGLFLLIAVPAVFYRIHVEERMLLEHFGEEWKEYTAATSALWPFKLRS